MQFLSSVFTFYHFIIVLDAPDLWLFHFTLL